MAALFVDQSEGLMEPGDHTGHESLGRHWLWRSCHAWEGIAWLVDAVGLPEYCCSALKSVQEMLEGRVDGTIPGWTPPCGRWW
jgi:hypothetical protein